MVWFCILGVRGHQKAKIVSQRWILFALKIKRNLYSNFFFFKMRHHYLSWILWAKQNLEKKKLDLTELCSFLKNDATLAFLWVNSLRHEQWPTSLAFALMHWFHIITRKIRLGELKIWVNRWYVHSYGFWEGCFKIINKIENHE